MKYSTNISRSIIAPAVIAVLIFPCLDASAERICLRNGGELIGNILEENAAEVVIDMSVGRLTINRDEIASIEALEGEESADFENEMERRAIESGAAVPDGEEKLGGLFVKAKEHRGKVEGLKSRHKDARGEIDEIEKRIRALYSLLREESATLKSIDPGKKIAEYNAAVAEINRVQADIEEARGKLERLGERYKALSKELSAAVSIYSKTLDSLYSLYKTRQAKYGDSAGGDEGAFYEVIGENIEEMKADFKREMVECEASEGQITVEAYINEHTYTRLVLDTGASLVVISEGLARQLNIDPEGIEDEMEVLVADGSVVKAKPILLASVKVEGAEARNVSAVIIKDPGTEGAEGLLGMSFLEHFTIHIDKAGKGLVLESLR